MFSLFSDTLLLLFLSPPYGQPLPPLGLQNILCCPGTQSNTGIFPFAGLYKDHLTTVASIYQQVSPPALFGLQSHFPLTLPAPDDNKSDFVHPYPKATPTSADVLYPDYPVPAHLTP